MELFDMRIGDEWCSGENRFEVVDPYTGDAWALAPEASKADVSSAVSAARAALSGEWSAMSVRQRANLMRSLGREIIKSADELALLETRDNGKLLREMRSQIASLPDWYDYYASLVETMNGRVVDTWRENYFCYVTKEPIGVVAAVLPWNSPLLLMTFKLAPALAAGCTFVAKPSEQASTSILRFARLIEDAGFPPGVFNTVSGQRRDVGKWLVSDPGVDHVTFTGSEATGVAVGMDASSHLVRSTLELGGKSANIVFPDVDVDAAVSGLLSGIFAAAGQTCIAGSRALIHRDVYESVMEKMVERAADICLGDPKDPKTEMGPICFPGQLAKIRNAVADALDAGAVIQTGGGDGGLGGLFYEPTILTDVPNTARICQKEIFGPVLVALPFDTEEEAIELANDTPYGLAAGIWTSDLRRAFRLTESLKAGTIWVNSYRTLSHGMPFGGMKRSGVGRENGQEGIEEYLESKAIWIEKTGASRDPFKMG